MLLTVAVAGTRGCRELDSEGIIVLTPSRRPKRSICQFLAVLSRMIRLSITVLLPYGLVKDQSEVMICGQREDFHGFSQQRSV